MSGLLFISLFEAGMDDTTSILPRKERKAFIKNGDMSFISFVKVEVDRKYLSANAGDPTSKNWLQHGEPSNFACSYVIINKRGEIIDMRTPDSILNLSDGIERLCKNIDQNKAKEFIREDKLKKLGI